MAELRVKGTGTIKLFESDNTSSVTIASPASLGADRTITLPDADVTLVSGTMLAGTVAVGNGGTGATTLAGAGLTNAPGFQAKLSANQSPSGSTWTTVANDTEVYDSDGCYDNSSTYAFTPTTAGKYLAYWAVTADISVVPALKIINTQLRKNGSTVLYNYMANNDNNWVNMTSSGSAVVDMNGSSDYIDLQGYITVSSGANLFSTYGNTYFGAYRLIGV